MDGCLGTWDAHQWSNIHQEGLVVTPGSISSLIFDPIQESQKALVATSMAVPGAGILWGEGAAGPSSSLLMLNHHQQQLPMISSPSSGLMGRAGPNGTTSGSDTTNYSVEDDGISMIFSDCVNLLNFSRGESKNNPRKRNHNNNNIGFGLIQEMGPDPSPPKRSKKAKLGSSNISFQQGASSSGSSIEEPDSEAMKHMKEMIYRAAAFRPINIGPEAVMEKPKRKNVRVSSDPQTVAARQRRERVSERLRVLQKMVPGGTKLDTASMLDEAANYLKFLRSQVKALQDNNNNLIDHCHNYPPNHFSPPINLQFNPSSLPLIRMQKP